MIQHYSSITIMSNSTLNTHLTPSINYTRRDEIIFNIMDFIKCPILLDTTNEMIIFNHQFYNKDSFNQHHHNKTKRNRCQSSSGYNNEADVRLKDPRTSEIFNFTYALRSLLIFHPTREDVCATLCNRLSNILDKEIEDFLRWDHSRNFGSIFIDYIQSRAAPHAQNQPDYTSYIASLQNTAVSMLVATPIPPCGRQPSST